MIGDVWEQRYQMMLNAVPAEELTFEELKLIEWLAEWDGSVARRFVSIAKKIRDKRRVPINEAATSGHSGN